MPYLNPNLNLNKLPKRFLKWILLKQFYNVFRNYRGIPKMLANEIHTTENGRKKSKLKHGNNERSTDLLITQSFVCI